MKSLNPMFKLKVWFCDVLLRPGFEFYKNYKVPQTRNLHGYVDYINSLPATDTPEVFGLHANADITYQINTAKGDEIMYEWCLKNSCKIEKCFHTI